ncbi:tubulin polyglutamylase TTLL13 [Sergentomyia squamirostris]
MSSKINSSLSASQSEGSQENSKKKEKLKKNRQVKFCASSTRYQSITRVAKNLGYRMVNQADAWNILWSDVSVGPEVIRQMKSFQRINHFPGMQELSMKRRLARNLNRMQKYFPEDYGIFPRTWCLPMELNDAQEFSRCHPATVFILKPDHGSQGKGIRLCRNLRTTSMTQEKLICQEYVKNPLLIDGFKFDMRIYVLITDLDPLRIFVYNEGLARLATKTYKQPSIHNSGNMFMHLTNYSLNKRSQSFSSDTESGSKRTFAILQRILEENGHDVQEIWKKIDDVIIKTILSSYSNLKHISRATFHNRLIHSPAFEILGFDIIIDKHLKPLVLEVNQSPSFHTDHEVDLEVKDSLIRDTLRLVLSSRKNMGNFRSLWPNDQTTEYYSQFLENSSALVTMTKNVQMRISQRKKEEKILEKQKPVIKIIPEVEVNTDWTPVKLESFTQDEHERQYTLEQRSALVRLSGIQNLLVLSLFQNDALTWSDQIKFKRLIHKLKTHHDPVIFEYLDIDSSSLDRASMALRGVRKNRTTMLREISRTLDA